MKQPCVYILASEKNGTLYTGVTSNLLKRIWDHKNKVTTGFTEKYDIHDLVYFELHQNMEYAIIREKQIKKWKRQWKINLIEKDNKAWADLWNRIH
ncbi:MAG: GIY-YIG nuclease family protein [Desulfobacterales bacterium]|nr:GIY-YIG nuclease family protein [Desulfobacterales bacterium]